MSVSAHYPPFVIKIRVFLSLLASPVLNICHVFVIADPPEKWFINGPRDWGSDGEVEALNCVALQKKGRLLLWQVRKQQQKRLKRCTDEG